MPLDFSLDSQQNEVLHSTEANSGPDKIKVI